MRVRAKGQLHDDVAPLIGAVVLLLHKTQLLIKPLSKTCRLHGENRLGFRRTLDQSPHERGADPAPVPIRSHCHHTDRVLIQTGGADDLIDRAGNQGIPVRKQAPDVLGRPQRNHLPGEFGAMFSSEIVRK